MHTLMLTGRNIFSIGLAALAILGLINQDFIIGRPPAWAFFAPLYPALAYLSNAVIISATLAIILNRKGKTAAWVIAGLILLLSVSRHLSNSMQDWLNTYKTLALLGGSVIVAASFETSRGIATRWAWAGSVLLAIFFIASGYAHFKFADFVIGFIPAYIPFHPFFTYFTAVCLIAGGLGILIPPVRKWAALLSGIMLAGWFLMLHIPRVLADSGNLSEQMGLCESFAFAGILFVLTAVLEKTTTTFSR